MSFTKIGSTQNIHLTNMDGLNVKQDANQNIDVEENEKETKEIMEKKRDFRQRPIH